MQDVREGHYPTNMDSFLVVMSDARSSLESGIEGHSEQELVELRDAGGWSVKDHLYHIAVWERGIRYLLLGWPRHEGMGLSAEQCRELDADGQNAIIFEQNKDRSLDEVMRDFQQEHQLMVDYLDSPACSWEDLNKPYSYYDPDYPGENCNEPILYWVFGNTAGHFEEHRPWIEKILGQAEQNGP